jgi:hypothetical protein
MLRPAFSCVPAYIWCVEGFGRYFRCSYRRHLAPKKRCAKSVISAKSPRSRAASGGDGVGRTSPARRRTVPTAGREVLCPQFRLRINCQTSVALGPSASPGAKVATRCGVENLVMLFRCFARHSCTCIDTVRRGLVLSEFAVVGRSAMRRWLGSRGLKAYLQIKKSRSDFPVGRVRSVSTTLTCAK